MFYYIASDCVSDCCLTSNEQFVIYINKMIMMSALYLINMLRWIFYSALSDTAVRGETCCSTQHIILS